MSPDIEPSSRLIPSAEIRACLAVKTRVVERAMRERFASEWSDPEIDLVFAHYLYGACSVIAADAEPYQQLAILRFLAGLSLSPEAVELAITTIPTTAKADLDHALQAAEMIGRRDAEAFRSQAELASVELIEPNTSKAICSAMQAPA